MIENNNRRFCVAPMMGYTTPYARKLYRILSRNSFLFTEMIAAKSMIHSKNKNLVIENNNHNPVALQVVGSDLNDLKIPHPKIEIRKFVLIPMLELADDFVHPILNKTIKQLDNDCNDQDIPLKII